MWVLFATIAILACGALLGFVISSFLVYDPRSYNQTIREEIGEACNSEDETCELYDPKIIQNHKMA
jgi:hypothetical protein